MTQHTDSSRIEADLEESRSRLGATLDELQDRISVDSLARDALGMVRENAAAYASSIDSAVRANPLALALTGAGLAWLIFGGRKATPEPRKSALVRWEDEGGMPAPADDEAESTRWSQQIDALRARASHSLRGIESDARSRVGDLRDYAAERAKVLSDFTADMQKSLSDGLEGLSDAGKERIVKAREAAYAARLKVERSARAGGREAERMLNEHPMVAGGVALALGAALAAALPRTMVEDRTFGAESDRLMALAATQLREERSRLKDAASALADDLGERAKSAVDKTVDDLGDKAKSAAHKAADDLTDKAEKATKTDKPRTAGMTTNV
ncbi:MAG: DUF3618 domain-containing protein [Pseudooceanicola sp.]|nr:DUF3618 domain-containing protein [Pseudooceanicola sp.]